MSLYKRPRVIWIDWDNSARIYHISHQQEISESGKYQTSVFFCSVTAVKSTTASPPTVANNKTITTTILPQTTTKTTTSWVNSSSVLTSQEITKENNTTPFSFTKAPSTGRSRETSATSAKHKSMTATGLQYNTTGEARGIVRETRNQPKATRNVVNVIISLMISLIVIGGVAGGAVFYWFRKRWVRVCSREVIRDLKIPRRGRLRGRDFSILK